MPRCGRRDALEAVPRLAAGRRCAVEAVSTLTTRCAIPEKTSKRSNLFFLTPWKPFHAYFSAAPCRLSVSTNLRAICRRTRQFSSPKFLEGVSGI